MTKTFNLLQPQVFDVCYETN